MNEAFNFYDTRVRQVCFLSVTFRSATSDCTLFLPTDRVVNQPYLNVMLDDGGKFTELLKQKLALLRSPNNAQNRRNDLRKTGNECWHNLA